MKIFLSFIKKYYFFLIIISFFIYSVITIYQTSYVISGVRFFSLSDDEMTGMRYAYNLAHGYGLVFNANSVPVEGITNPLWVFIMALFHLVPISFEKISILIQFTGTVFTICSLYFIKRIADFISNSSIFVSISSLILSAFYFPIINWNIVQGTEVSLLMFLISICVFLTIKSYANKKFSLALYILLGIGTMVRLDFTISATILVLFLLIFDQKNIKKNLFGLLIIILFLAVQEAARILYYHDVLPNTYYQKMTGYSALKRILRGLYVGLKSFSPNIAAAQNSQFLQFIERTAIGFMLIISFIFSFVRKNKYLSLFIILFTAQELYSIYVGGDVWEYYGGANRFIAYVMPLYFITLMVAINSIKYLNKKPNILILIFFCVFFLFNRANTEELSRLFLIMKPTTVDQATHVNQTRTKLYLDLKKIVKPDARIAMAATGLVPYFLYDKYFCDILGKNDTTIAHGTAVIDDKFSDFKYFQPGHMKWNYSHTVNDCKPDIFGDFYQYPNQHNDKYLLSKGYVKAITANNFAVYVNKKSPNINWRFLRSYP